MEHIEYKKATQADLQILVDHRLIFSDELAGKQEPMIEAALRESLTRYFSSEINKTYVCWYATVNREVAAIAGMGIRVQPGNVKNPSGIWGYIMSVHTMPAHRRKGLSGGLIDRLLETGREMGIKAFELHATAQGEQVYIKKEFELHPEPTYRKYI